MKRLQDEILKGIGAEVRRRRHSAGYSIDRLAGLAGLHKNSVSKIELGQIDLSISALWAIAVALECDIADLLPSAQHRMTPDVLAAARILAEAAPKVRTAVVAMFATMGPSTGSQGSGGGEGK
jgi:transcriptional regulator with XRE-family HTH domain